MLDDILSIAINYVIGIYRAKPFLKEIKGSGFNSIKIYSIFKTINVK